MAKRNPMINVGAKKIEKLKMAEVRAENPIFEP